MVAAAGRHLVLALRSGTSARAVFVVFVLVVPMVLLLVVNALRLAVEWLRDRRDGRR
jgi:hypothetical protein